MRYFSRENGLKVIARSLCLTYGTVRWNLAILRRDFAVRTTRELLIKIQSCGVNDEAHHSPIRVSPRGRQVLELFCRSYSRQQIADQLGMSLSGVRRHCEKMLWKNGCESMLALIAKYKAQFVVEGQSEIQL